MLVSTVQAISYVFPNIQRIHYVMDLGHQTWFRAFIIIFTFYNLFFVFTIPNNTLITDLILYAKSEGKKKSEKQGVSVLSEINCLNNWKFS